MPVFTSAVAVLGLVATTSAFSVHAGGGSRFAPTFPRSALTARMLTPYRQDDTYNYYRIPVKKEVVLSKPLGVDVVPGSPLNEGMVVDGLQEGAGAAAELKKGDRIESVNGADVTQMPFDDVMAMLASAPTQITIGFSRTSISRKLRESDALASAPAAAAAAEELEPSKLDKAFAKNFGSVEATQKILSKTAKITTNAATWKNPIYFWSVAGTALLFVPIIWYSVTK